jgi:hypothetical protein
MAAHVLTTGYESPAPRAWADPDDPDEALGDLTPSRSSAALLVAVAAMLLAASPAVVAAVAIVSPGDLNRAFGWVLSGSAAFSVMAAGRVPAAALLAVALAVRRNRP